MTRAVPVAIALADAARRLPGPVGAREARILLAEAAETTLAGITGLDHLSATCLQLFEALVARRVAGEPISHILGRRAFWRHEFLVSSDVLDPRPDTETLVEAALQVPFRTVLDLGTGSGCILLSVLAERPDAVGLGVDICDRAVAVARQNATRLGLSSRAEFRQSNWASAVTGRYDLVVSNPPYIDTASYAALDPGVRNWEPRGALEAGADGLDAYRALVAQTPQVLAPGGALALEIGWDQGQSVPALLRGAGFDEIRVLSDLNGKDRVVLAKLI